MGKYARDKSRRSNQSGAGISKTIISPPRKKRNPITHDNLTESELDFKMKTSRKAATKVPKA
jgi:hypothetical protein